MIRKLLYKIQKRRFCKLNRWSCPDCIYHDFVFEGAIFRGNKCRYPKYRERSEAEREAFDTAIEALKSESIFTADRPRGEWIEQEDDYHHYWECSECGMGVGLDDIRNFCPNCGADMRGDTK